MLAWSSNCFWTRTFDSYSATPARITSAATATPTVRPTSARSRLGAKRLPKNDIYTWLEVRDDLLAVRALDPVDERFDRGLHLRRIGVVREVQRPADRVGTVRERLAGRRDIVDRQELDVRRVKGCRVHGHHPDRVLEGAERLERLIDLEDLDRVFRVRRLRRAEEVRFERGARRGLGLAQQHPDLRRGSADVLPVGDLTAEDLRDLVFRQALHT